MFKHLLWIAFIAGLVASQISDTRKAKIINLYIGCMKLSKRIQFVNCSKHFENRKSTLSAAFRLVENVGKAQLFVNGTMYFDGGRKIDYGISRIDWCKITSASKSGRNVLSLFVRRLLAASVNLPTKCPIAKDITYALQNYYVEVGMFSNFLPPMNYTIHLTIAAGSEHLMQFRVDGVVCVKQEFCQIYM